MYKRYQYFAAHGEIKWTNWFKISSAATHPKWQLRGKLLNEYKNNL